MTKLIAYSVLLVLSLAACQATSRTPTGVEVVRLPDEPKAAPPPREFNPPHARSIPFFDPAAPDTVRTYAPFKRIKAGMPLMEVIQRCGLPDGDFGNLGGAPSHLLIWDLKDGSWVSIKSDGLKLVEEIGRGYPIKAKRRKPS